MERPITLSENSKATAPRQTASTTYWAIADVWALRDKSKTEVERQIEAIEINFKRRQACKVAQRMMIERLAELGKSEREISRELSVPKSTVHDALNSGKTTGVDGCGD